jgi:hypothetical protein
MNEDYEVVTRVRSYYVRNKVTGRYVMGPVNWWRQATTQQATLVCDQLNGKGC